jgi:hypothetical protein
MSEKMRKGGGVEKERRSSAREHAREEREEENGRRSVGWRGERKRDIGRWREGERERENDSILQINTSAHTHLRIQAHTRTNAQTIMHVLAASL